MPIPPMGLASVPQDGRLQTAVLEDLIQYVGAYTDEQVAVALAQAQKRAVAIGFVMGLVGG